MNGIILTNAFTFRRDKSAAVAAATPIAIAVCGSFMLLLTPLTLTGILFIDAGKFFLN